jgi:hypothetical protein
MYSFIDYRVVYPPVEGNMLAKIRNGNPKIQEEGETANFLEKFGKMLAFFFGGGKTSGAKMEGFGTRADIRTRGVETRCIASLPMA